MNKRRGKKAQKIKETMARIRFEPILVQCVCHSVHAVKEVLAASNSCDVHIHTDTLAHTHTHAYTRVQNSGHIIKFLLIAFSNGMFPLCEMMRSRASIVRSLGVIACTMRKCDFFSTTCNEMRFCCCCHRRLFVFTCLISFGFIEYFWIFKWNEVSKRIIMLQCDSMSIAANPIWINAYCFMNEFT